MDTNYIISLLKTKGCRITPQRKIIITILVKHQYELLTADQLLILCQIINPDINSTTIYRNLELLDSMKLVYKLTNQHAITTYKIICHTNHHHHIICLNCGKMLPIDYCPINPELEALIAEHDFTLIDHNLEFYGYCKKCNITNN